VISTKKGVFQVLYTWTLTAGNKGGLDTKKTPEIIEEIEG
jgi:PKD repeat protein